MKSFLTVSFIVFSAMILRLVPHVPNFAPVGALALFGGVYIGKKYSFLIIILTMLLSDYLLLYIHPFSSQVLTLSQIYPLKALFHSTTLYVYGSFALNIVMGMFLKKHFTTENLIFTSIFSSITFFLITNFGVWAAGYYSRSFTGLMESYIMGLPFFRATVFGDLFYNGLFFGGYAIVTKIVSQQILRKSVID